MARLCERTEGKGLLRPDEQEKPDCFVAGGSRNDQMIKNPSSSLRGPFPSKGRPNNVRERTISRPYPGYGQWTKTGEALRLPAPVKDYKNPSSTVSGTPYSMLLCSASTVPSPLDGKARETNIGQALQKKRRLPGIKTKKRTETHFCVPCRNQEKNGRGAALAYATTQNLQHSI